MGWTIRTITTALAVCLAIGLSANKAAPQVTNEQEKPSRSDIRGVVTYADTGRPLRHASVAVIVNDNGDGLRSAITNGRGQFVVENLPAGRYLLYVDALGILKPNAYEQNKGPVTSQLRLNEKRDLFTEVVVNGTDTVEVKLQAVRGGVITGRVMGEDDQPVPDADVKLLKRENGKWVPVQSTWGGISEDSKRKTDPSGAYRIAGLEAGEYIVRASEPSIGYDVPAAEEQAYSDGSLMVTYYPAATSIKEAQAVSVVEGSESSGIDIRMPDRIPRRIYGIVTTGSDDKIAGFAGILIERVDELGFVDPVLNSTVRADAEGKWEARGIPAGEYRIRFEGSLRTERGTHIDLAPKYVSVTVANEDVELNTRLDAAATIFGKLKFEGGAMPDEDELYDFRVGVTLASERSEPPRNNQGHASKRDYETGYMREGGKFEIRELAPGKYWFLMPKLPPDRYYVKSVIRKGVDLAKSPFKLDAGAVFDDVLVTIGADVATIEGQLTDWKPKTTPAEMIVMLAPANDATRRFSPGLLTTHPDAQGKFVFNCGPGEYFVAVITRAERKKMTTPITEDYFNQDNQKFQRVKVRAGEKTKIRV